VGGYVLVKQIGAGGMGEVWLAEHVMLGRRAAMKFLHASIARRNELVTRFFNEARAATTIADPGIVQVFDFGHADDGSAYIVMELLEGETLEQRCRRSGTISVADALRITRQIANTLVAAHARGIVHRDLKPENIFLVPDAEVAGGERVKLVDFGIAKLSTDAGLKTQTSAVMGTPAFMSPEQCRGAGVVDHRADIYSLGCVLFAILTGRPPFVADGAGELIVMHMTQPPPRASSASPHVPPAIDALIARCLAKDPAQRFASAAELASAIDDVRTTAAQPTVIAPRPFQSSSSTTLSSAASVVETAPARTSRAWLGAVAFLLVFGGGIAWFASRSPSQATSATEPLLDASMIAQAVDAAIDAAIDAPPVVVDAAIATTTDAVTDTVTRAATDAAIAPVDAAPRPKKQRSSRPTPTDKPLTIDDIVSPR